MARATSMPDTNSVDAFMWRLPGPSDRRWERVQSHRVTGAREWHQGIAWYL